MLLSLRQRTFFSSSLTRVSVPWAQLLNLNPIKRPPAPKALQHAWLHKQKLDTSIDELMLETQQALAQFNARRALEKVRKSTGLRPLPNSWQALLQDVHASVRNDLPPAELHRRKSATLRGA